MKTLQTEAQRARDRRAYLAEQKAIERDRERAARNKADPAGAAARYRREAAKRRRDLLDPKFGPARFFPKWTMGQTTLQYVRTYNALNHVGPNPLQFTFVDRVAPFNLPEPGCA